MEYDIIEVSDKTITCPKLFKCSGHTFHQTSLNYVRVFFTHDIKCIQNKSILFILKVLLKSEFAERNNRLVISKKFFLELAECDFCSIDVNNINDIAPFHLAINKYLTKQLHTLCLQLDSLNKYKFQVEVFIVDTIVPQSLQFLAAAVCAKNNIKLPHSLQYVHRSFHWPMPYYNTNCKPLRIYKIIDSDNVK